MAASALLVSDILWLRALMVVANCSGIAVNYFVIKPRFWTGIRWGLFFLCINLFQIFRIIMERKDVEFENPEQEELYDSLFAEVYTRPEFKRLLRIAQVRDVASGEVLLTVGQPMEAVFAVVSGALRINDPPHGHRHSNVYVQDGAKNGTAPSPPNTLATAAGTEEQGEPDYPGGGDGGSRVLGPGNMIGENAMVLGLPGSGSAVLQPSTATVTAVGPTRCLIWNNDDLQRLFFERPSLAVGWNAVVSTLLLSRLQEQHHVAMEAQYRLFLFGVLADGVVKREERDAVEVYARKYQITPDLHAKALAEYGWTVEEWEKGRKNGRYWLQPLHAVKEVFIQAKEALLPSSATPSPAPSDTPLPAADAVAPGASGEVPPPPAEPEGGPSEVTPVIETGEPATPEAPSLNESHPPPPPAVELA